jgi:hypothetical protein
VLKISREQLQNERKAFIRVVHSQNKALDEAMKEVEKAKKEAAKFKAKRDKEKEKEKEEEPEPEDSRDPTINLPKRNSTPYSYKPPPPYTLHSAPSVSQLVYHPPSLERFNSVRKSNNAVTTLALSLEPVKPTNADVPTPPTSPPDNMPYNSQFYPPFTQPPPPSQTGRQDASNSSQHTPQDDTRTSQQQRSTRPEPPGKRVFSDPGPEHSRSTSSEHLNTGSIPRERSRSPYGYTRVPNEHVPKVERKRPSFQSSFNSTSTSTPSAAPQNHRTFSTPAYGSTNMGSVPEENFPAPADPHTSPASPTTDHQKPSFTYYPPPPPPPPIYHELPTEHNTPTSSTPPRKSSLPPPPPPRHGTTYVVLTPYLSHEVGHLSLVPFDTLVDVVSYTPEESDLPYPTAFDGVPKHYWQASLGHRRGPRGLFPVEVVCTIDDERVSAKMSESWFAEEKVGFIADGQGRCWVGPTWEWTEPLRRRSKWWTEEF